MKRRTTELFKDIHDALGIDSWCKRNSYSMNILDELNYSWKQFSDQVKYRSNYVFYRVEEKENKLEGQSWIKIPFQILDRISEVVNELGLIITLPIGTKIYRCRSHEENEKPRGVKELGPPPRDKTKSNRMSPAGIVMFYGSRENYTAYTETKITVGDKPYAFTLAKFETVKDIKVLDLTKKICVQSFFKKGQKFRRQSKKFINKFIHDIKEPVMLDDNEHIEYVPTQIVAEYFRSVFRDTEGESIKGIIYPSSIEKNGSNIVLFIDNNNIISDKKDISDREKDTIEIVLKLIEDTHFSLNLPTNRFKSGV